MGMQPFLFKLSYFSLSPSQREKGFYVLGEIVNVIWRLERLLLTVVEQPFFFEGFIEKSHRKIWWYQKIVLPLQPQFRNAV